MSTMTDEQNVTDETELLSEEFWSDYTEPEAPQVRTMPPDGRYTVRMPDVISESCFEVRKDRDGRPYLAITLDPVTVVSENEAYNGHSIRYFRVDTRPETNFVKDGDQWKADGTTNSSNAADILKNFGITSNPRTIGEFKTAFKQIEGQTSPNPFYLTWNGYDKKASGKAKYLKSKDFPTLGDGTRPSSVERTDPATGATYRVFANLTLGRRGAAVRQ
jgi:hypothetical protein